MKKDEILEPQLKDLRAHFSSQFAKAYFNIGMLLDREGEYAEATEYYEKAYYKELNHLKDPQEGASVSMCFVKTATNLAVCYEKQGLRDQAMKVCKLLREHGINHDAKLNNNMGVLFKRENQHEAAIECFNRALADESSAN